MRTHIAKSISNSCDQIAEFGPLFMLRHLGRMLRLNEIKIRTKFGVIHVRPRNSDAAAFAQVFVDRPYDLAKVPQFERVMAAYRAILASGREPVIIDAGANVGAAARWFSRQYPEATIVAVEPDADAARICRKNIAALPKVRLMEAAIGATSGRVNLETNGQSWASQTVRSVDGHVTLVTISDVIALAGEKAVPFIVKIDIEGFESDLFSSATEWVATVPVVMIEPHDWLFPGRHTSASFLKTFADSRHEMVILGGDTLAFVL